MKPDEVAAVLKKADNILIITHKNPDGDTIGSACALCRALRRIGKKAYLYDNQDITETFREYSNPLLADSKFIPEFIVTTDVSALDMLPKGYDGTDFDLVIDHHGTNEGFGKYNCVYPDKSSCGELILEILEKLGGKITNIEADLLYIAVSTDTGCFQYSNTNPDTFNATARILALGANNTEINNKLFIKASKSRITLEGLIYSSLKFYHDGKVVTAVITKEMMEKANATTNDLDNIASLVQRVQEEIIGITIREMDDGKSKVSVRSSEMDSALICSYFGGGGHKGAAGCTIDADVNKAEKLIVEVLDTLWTASC